jgi:hypothetical protein
VFLRYRSAPGSGLVTAERRGSTVFPRYREATVTDVPMKVMANQFAALLEAVVAIAEGNARADPAGPGPS